MLSTASLSIRAAAILFFGCTAIAALRLAIADTLARQETPERVAQAIAFQSPTPSAELEEVRAELDPTHAEDALERAAKIDPHSSTVWIALGLLRESQKDLPGAERSLLRAAQVDRQYLPAWTLANFYFRRANRDGFWIWADRAAALTYDDFRPLLRLADQFEPDPTRLLVHFHNTSKLLPSYLDLLIGEDRLDTAQQVARAMEGDRANDPHLIDLADRQLRAGKALPAIELWNVASGFAPIDPSAGKILTNGNLLHAPLNLGFDWRLGQVEGIAESWRPSELIFALSGTQPETCILLEQTIYLVKRPFRLRFDYVAGDSLTKQLHWALDDIEGPSIEPSPNWREGVFDLPLAQGLRNLKLFYRREPGTMRAEGRIELRDLHLDAL